jgi:hypothetical protein
MPIIKTAVGTTATLVQAATDRKWFILQNQSDTDIYVSFEGTTGVTTDAGANPGIEIMANGGSLATGEGEFNPNLNASIYAIHGGTGTKNLVLHHI